MAQIADLLDILAKPARITAIIARRAAARSATQFGDKRRSEIVAQRRGPRRSRT